MRAVLILLVFLVLPPVFGLHDEGCVPTQADPSEVNQFDLASLGGSLYYLEERGNPLGTNPPVPLSGFLLADLGGGGTWFYDETNALPGLQRGSWDLGPCWPPPPFFCLLFVQDPVWDEECGHGPDTLLNP